jgi:predicted deacylase
MTQLGNKALTIGGVQILPGERKRIDLPIAKLYDYTEMKIPVEVIRGKKDGPTLFISAAIHGDEINGTETIKRLLAKKRGLGNLSGTLIAVPVVNIYGYNNKVRYLPDRRDLNRCFPGSPTGPLAMQVAHTFMNEIVQHCTHGIDLHTGAIHRTNLPQIRAVLDDEETSRLAKAFGTPVILNSSIRDGSLRQAVVERGASMLLFEGGEALRFSEKVVSASLHGILNVMHAIGMLPEKHVTRKSKPKEVFIARSSHWVRAPHSGSMRLKKQIGAKVKKNEILGIISDPFGSNKFEVKARATGIVIGMSLLPLVNEGDALFHVATFDDTGVVEEHIELYGEMLDYI